MLCRHIQICRPSAAHDNYDDDQEEEDFEDDDNADEDDKLVFDED